MKKLILLIPFLSLGQTQPKWMDELSNSTEKDKAKHYWVSAIGTCVIATSLDHYIERPTISSWVGGVTMFGVGLGKEYIWDGRMKRGVKSGGDLFMDGMGCLGGVMIGRVIINIKERKRWRIKEDYYEITHDYRDKYEFR